MQGRGNYREACRHLKKFRTLHEKLGQSEAWAAHIAKLREEHKRLPALKEELNKAQL